MSFIVVIPARFNSSRLPGKVLADIGGKPMLFHTYHQALKSAADRVVVATDNEEVAEVAKGFGAEVCMTAASHPTGTDRLQEACQLLGVSDEMVVVNLQADEPFVEPSFIDAVAKVLVDRAEASVGTLAAPIRTYEEVNNPNIVKVVLNQHSEAIYFSRATIPWDRDGQFAKGRPLADTYLRHIGLYSYRAGYLDGYINTPACDAETVEGLEQLRVLWRGDKIGVAVIEQTEFLEVNTAEDLEYVRGVYLKRA